ncbi:hypothetical protein UFOVP1516_74 [uncultured Caudovirales phage]|uniref:Putative DnaT-like domain-containing protein n=1 Tax=uncultured Caudovirales phage TaxID=2100421 RepID=A0A6J5PBI4_9CAUD|nr:hypothetical protein UFOVP887_61 [uncultured Caudovirales phage]CAB5226952.1 hypothetical protein UFOVP1516_74 [uncultured Caudovirales phage]
MSLIVEDGTGTLASESYCSVAFADIYHANRNNIDWDTLGTTDKEAVLRKATDYMVEAYRSLWKGYKVLATQALDFPRQMLYLVGEIPNNTTALSSTSVPLDIQKACAVLALKAITDDLLIDTEQQVVKETIGPISTEYQPYANKYKHYTAVEAMLKPYLKSSSSTVIR